MDEHTDEHNKHNAYVYTELFKQKQRYIVESKPSYCPCLDIRD